MKIRIWGLALLLALMAPAVMAAENDATVVVEEMSVTVEEAGAEKEAVKKKVIEDIYEDLETFANSLTIINGYYVDETSPKDLIYGALKGMLNSLDPYSQFLDPESHEDIKVETEGRFGGIGIEISVRDEVLTVITAIDDTPAAKAGLEPEDKIVRINGESTRKLGLDDAVGLLRGKPGTEVDLSVLREGESKILDFTLKRDIIQVQSIRKAFMLDKNIAYIRITDFKEASGEDLKKALRELERKPLKGLVFDLRNNPGGLLPSAIDVAGAFVPKGELIVSTRGRDPKQDMEFLSKGVSQPKDYPIVVLINKGSASASEIVAGALQDHHLAILLGTQTFGKGSVQTVIPMRDGSALRLTTSKYFTPADRMIHGTGIAPDVEVPYVRPIITPEDEEDDKNSNKAKKIFEKVEETIFNQDDEEIEIPEDARKLLENDNQVQRAVDLLRALNVYQTQKPVRKTVSTPSKT